MPEDSGKITQVKLNTLIEESKAQAEKKKINPIYLASEDNSMPIIIVDDKLDKLLLDGPNSSQFKGYSVVDENGFRLAAAPFVKKELTYSSMGESIDFYVDDLLEYSDNTIVMQVGDLEISDDTRDAIRRLEPGMEEYDTMVDKFSGWVDDIDSQFLDSDIENDMLEFYEKHYGFQVGTIRENLGIERAEEKETRLNIEKMIGRDLTDSELEMFDGKRIAVNAVHFNLKDLEKALIITDEVASGVPFNKQTNWDLDEGVLHPLEAFANANKESGEEEIVFNDIDEAIAEFSTSKKLNEKELVQQLGQAEVSKQESPAKQTSNSPLIEIADESDPDIVQLKSLKGYRYFTDDEMLARVSSLPVYDFSYDDNDKLTATKNTLKEVLEGYGYALDVDKFGLVSVKDMVDTAEGEKPTQFTNSWGADEIGCLLEDIQSLPPFSEWEHGKGDEMLHLGSAYGNGSLLPVDQYSDDNNDRAVRVYNWDGVKTAKDLFENWDEIQGDSLKEVDKIREAYRDEQIQKDKSQNEVVSKNIGKGR